MNAITATPAEIQQYADKVWDMVGEDMYEGVLPGNVRTFTELHDHVDANEYTIQADVPFDPMTDDGMIAVAAVEAEINRRLAERFESLPVCTNPTHDHTTTINRNGHEVNPPIAMACSDCNKSAHYDAATGAHHHDDPAAPACFLAGPNTANPCTYGGTR